MFAERYSVDFKFGVPKFLTFFREHKLEIKISLHKNYQVDRFDICRLL